MATQKKTSKSGGSKKPQVKLQDMKPRKDAKGGLTRHSKLNQN